VREKLPGKQVKLPTESVSKAHHRLLDCIRASGL
jgi:hypothetical protein